MSELSRLIDLIEIRLAMVPAWKYEDRDSWAAHESAVGKIIDDLVEREDARFAQSGCGGFSLKLGGVRTSCTSGEHGLLKNWVTAARRRMAVQA